MSTAVVNFSTPKQSARRFWLIILGVFVAAIFMIFVGLWMRDGIALLMTKETVIEPSRDYPRLSPQLEKNLAESFNTTFEWQSPDIFDPYKDRAGLDGKTANVVGGGTVNSTPANMPNIPTPNNYRNMAQNFPNQVMPVPQQQQQQPTFVPQTNQEQTRVSGTKERVEQVDRDSRYTGNNNASNSELYEVEDVEPLGIVGDKKSREILFYNSQTKRTVPVRQGQRFYNGRFVAVTEDGVVIETDSGTKVVKNWVRDRKNTQKSNNPNPQLDVDFNPKSAKSTQKP